MSSKRKVEHNQSGESTVWALLHLQLKDYHNKVHHNITNWQQDMRYHHHQPQHKHPTK